MGDPVVAQSIEGVNVTISVERSDNGAIIVGNFAAGGQVQTRRAGVQSRDLNSDQAKRKVQRTLVKWIKQYFPAPVRKDAGKEKAKAAS
jgi:hypothetical protein